MKIDGYSFTRLNDYAKCPYYFKKKHIDKIKVVEQFTLEGKIIHDILRAYANECYRKNQTHLFGEEDDWEALAYDVLSEYDIPAQQEKDILEHIKNYISGNEIELDGLIGVEEEVAVDKDFNAIDWKSKDVFFRFVFDKLYISGSYCKISDYKSGYNMKPDLFQLELYAWGVVNIYPQIESIEVEWDFTRFGYKTTSNFTSKDINKIDKKIRKKIERIEKATELEPKVNSLCSFCPYWENCPAMEKADINKIDNPKELVKNYVVAKKHFDEIKNKLKYVIENKGKVEYEDLKANYKAYPRYTWDLPKLISWANGNGIDIMGCLSVNARKVEKITGINLDDFRQTKLYTRLKVGKNKAR